MPPYYELIVLICAILSGCRARPPPNILWVVVDDLGWSDVQWRSEGQVLTPTLNSLRKSGVELTNMQFFKFCSPARSSFMTGRTPFHTLQVLAGPCLNLNHNYTLLPQLLQTAGYHTAHAGKWHLGAWGSHLLPTSRGFNQSLAYLCLSGWYDHFSQQGQYYCPGDVDLWLNNGPARQWNGTFDTELYTRYAVDVIEDHAKTRPSSPLYMHVEYHSVHEPVQSPTYYQKRYPHVNSTCRKTYCGMLSAVDDGVSNLTMALQSTGMYDNSIIIVTTDNGGLVSQHGCGANYPLRGGKHSFFAGGIQGVALVHSPLLPPAVWGSVFSGLAHASDWYPTLANIAGVSNFDDTGPFPVDGTDLWPYLTGTKGGNAHQELLIAGCRPDTNNTKCNGALIVGELKLVVGKQNPAGWPGIPGISSAPYEDDDVDDCSNNCVFNMTADPLEKINLATLQPATLAMLMERFHNLSSEHVPQDPGPKSCSTAVQCGQAKDNGGFFGPWEA